MNELATTTQDRQVQVAEAPLSPGELIQQVKLIQEVMKSVMQPGQHYGTIPGCGPKPALFKPGAEKLQLTFRLHPDFEIQETDLPQGHKNFRVVCRLMNQSGGFQGAGVGYGSTRETKYLHKAGRESNPADFYNTVLKMSKKRAQVDAILTSTAASDIFTQDLEDFDEARLGAERRGASSHGVARQVGQEGDETLSQDKFIAKKFPGSQENDRGTPPSSEPGARVSDPAAPEPAYWQGTIESVASFEGTNAQGAWKIWHINLDENRSASTFKEELAKDAEIMVQQGPVKVFIEPNKRKPGKFTYLGFEAIEQPTTPQPAEELPW